MNSRAIAKVKQNCARINPAHCNPKEDIKTEALLATGDCEQTMYRNPRLSSLTMTCISDGGPNYILALRFKNWSCDITFWRD